MIAKASQVECIAAFRLVNQLGAGRGDQDERAMDIGAAEDVSRTIVHFETRGQRSTGLAGQQGIFEFLGKRERGFDGWCWKATASGCCRGDRRSGRANHVYSYDRPA